MTESAPFSGPTPVEVALRNAPLARVVAQVRFPVILAIDGPGGVRSFQEAIRPTYPVLKEEDVREVTVGALGDVKVSKGTLWRFADADDRWRVSLSTNFVALETRAYISRADFISRLSDIIQAAETAFQPQVAERLGLRYVNRVEGTALERLSSLVRPEMLGVWSSPIAPLVRLSITETHFSLLDQGNEILMRHGLLPAQMTYDPAVEPVQSPSWVLDLDGFRATRMSFDAVELSELADRLAEQCYRLFRWIVNEAFLREHGAES